VRASDKLKKQDRETLNTIPAPANTLCRRSGLTWIIGEPSANPRAEKSRISARMARWGRGVLKSSPPPNCKAPRLMEPAASWWASPPPRLKKGEIWLEGRSLTWTDGVKKIDHWDTVKGRAPIGVRSVVTSRLGMPRIGNSTPTDATWKLNSRRG